MTTDSFVQRANQVAFNAIARAQSSQFELEEAIKLTFHSNPRAIAKYIALLLLDAEDSTEMLREAVLQNFASHHRDEFIAQVGRGSEAIILTANNYAATRADL